MSAIPNHCCNNPKATLESEPPQLRIQSCVHTCHPHWKLVAVRKEQVDHQFLHDRPRVQLLSWTMAGDAGADPGAADAASVAKCPAMKMLQPFPAAWQAWHLTSAHLGSSHRRSRHTRFPSFDSGDLLEMELHLAKNGRELQHTPTIK